MRANPVLSAVLERYKKGEIPLDEAAQEIEGLRLERVGDFACLDLGRAVRCGMPEVVLAEGKDPGQLAEIAFRHAETARPLCCHARDTRTGVRGAGTVCGQRDNGRIPGHSTGACPFDRAAPEPTGGIVAVITAGTSDIRVAEEAKIIAEEMGCTVRTAYDVGAAGIHRLFPALKPLLDADVFVVCAGREGHAPGRCRRSRG